MVQVHMAWCDEGVTQYSNISFMNIDLGRDLGYAIKANIMITN